MKRLFALAALAAALAVSRLGAPSTEPSGPEQPLIAYTLRPRPAAGDQEARTEVRLRVAGHGGRPFNVEMPVWSPGEYRVQNHGRYVRNMRLEGTGAGSLEATAEGAWEVTPAGAEPVTLAYELPNVPPGLFTENAVVRSRWAFYNGPAVFAYVAGREREPVSLRVLAPEGWPEAICGLDQGEDGDFHAPDYDTLADSPILVGDRKVVSFSLDGRPHDIVFFGRHSGTDYEDYRQVFQRIVGAAREYMGSLPYSRYVLFLDVGGRGGGLEHGSSARMAVPAGANPRFLARSMAHECFHLWNVKRIRPAVLGPFDYRKPPATRNLWFCEGVTEYVAGLLALRAGVLGEDAFLEQLGQSAGMALSQWRYPVTPETASLRIWDDGHSNGYRGVSVYGSGELIGLCLDLRLLHTTEGRAGLREVFRDLMERHAPPKPGYGEDGIREAVIRAGAVAMGAFYDRLCRTTEPPPVAECLAYAGLELEHGGFSWQLRPSQHASPTQTRLRHIWLYGR